MKVFLRFFLFKFQQFFIVNFIKLLGQCNELTSSLFSMYTFFSAFYHTPLQMNWSLVFVDVPPLICLSIHEYTCIGNLMDWYAAFQYLKNRWIKRMNCLWKGIIRTSHWDCECCNGYWSTCELMLINWEIKSFKKQNITQASVNASV